MLIKDSKIYMHENQKSVDAFETFTLKDGYLLSKEVEEIYERISTIAFSKRIMNDFIV